MNDDQAQALNIHLNSISQSLEEIARVAAQMEQRAALKAAKKAQKRAAGQLPKK